MRKFGLDGWMFVTTYPQNDLLIFCTEYRLFFVIPDKLRSKASKLLTILYFWTRNIHNNDNFLHINISAIYLLFIVIIAERRRRALLVLEVPELRR